MWDARDIGGHRRTNRLCRLKEQPVTHRPDNSWIRTANRGKNPQQFLENAKGLQDSFHILECLLVYPCLRQNMHARAPIVSHLARPLPSSNWMCKVKNTETIYGKWKTRRDLHFPIHPPPTYQKEGKTVIPSKMDHKEDFLIEKQAGVILRVLEG